MLLPPNCERATFPRSTASSEKEMHITKVMTPAASHKMSEKLYIYTNNVESHNYEGEIILHHIPAALHSVFRTRY